MSQKPFVLLLLAAVFIGGCAMRCYKPYDMGRGETLSEVCSRYGLSEAEIRNYNQLDRGFEPKEYDRIFIPCEAEAGAANAPPRRSDPNEPKPSRTKKTPPPAAVKPLPKPAPTIAIDTPVREESVAPATSAKLRRAGFGWPVEGEVVRGFTQGKDAPVNGIDIRAASGAPVLAAAAGKVEYVGVPANAYGPMILINHEGGLYTVYSHLGSLAIESGRRVEKGQKIAVAGSDSYVHFELREGRTSVDPLLYLPKR